MSLKRMLVLFMVFAVMLQLTGIWGLFLVNRASAFQNARALYQEQLDMQCENLEDFLTAKMETAYSLLYGEQIQRYIAAPHKQRFDTYKQILMLLDSSLLADKSCLGATLLFANGTSLVAGSYISATSALGRFLKEQYPPKKAFARAVFTHPLSALPSRAVQDKSVAPYHLFALVVPIYGDGVINPTMRYLGQLIVVFNAVTFMERVMGDRVWMLSSDEQVLLVCNALDSPVSLREQEGLTSVENQERLRVAMTETLARNTVSFRQDNEQLYFFASSLNQLGLTARTIHSEGELLETTQPIWWFSILLSIVMCVTSAGVLIMLYRTMLRPIRQIVGQLSDISSVNTSISNPEEQRNELTFLTDGINGMIKRIAALTQQELDIRERIHITSVQRTAERIVYLQTQMNPHFLYNNLECICGMAAEKDSGAVRSMCVTMAALYRYTLKSTRPIVSLRAETECLDSYSRILHLRYGERFRLENGIPDSLGHVKIPRMTLQPLVENAVVHGLQGHCKGDCRIRLTAETQPEAVIVSVEDNGAGMSDAELAQMDEAIMRSSLLDVLDQSDEHIGVVNVQLRLRLLLGESAGLFYKKSPLGGVHVQVCLPLLIDEENTEDSVHSAKDSSLLEQRGPSTILLKE